MTRFDRRVVWHATYDLPLAVDAPLVSPLIQSAIWSGGYEAGEAETALALTTRDDVVVELGAGLGFLAALTASRRHPRAYVAVEASPAMIPLIERTLSLNEASGVRVLNAAAATAADNLARGYVNFAADADFWASRVVSDNTGIRVSVVDLNRLLHEEGATILLVDIEGGEAELFEGADLSGLRHVSIELHDVIGAAAVGRIFDRMLAAGLVYNLSLSSRQIVVFSRPGA